MGRMSAPYVLDRTTGMGSTDVVEVAGLAPWKDAGPWRVWQAKTDPKPEEASEEQDWGNEIEPFLCDWYGRQVKRPIRRFPRGAFRVFNQCDPWLWASPDAFDPNDDVYMEVKNVGSFMAGHWDRTDDDGIPHYVRGQVTLGMYCAQRTSWKVVAAIGGLPPRIYHVDYDPELAGMLVDAGRVFWNRVKAGTPPPVDGSSPCREYLMAKYPRDERPFVESSIAAEGIAMARIASAEQRSRHDEVVRDCDAKLKEMCGDAAGILGDGWKFSWKVGRGGGGVRRSRFTVKDQDDE